MDSCNDALMQMSYLIGSENFSDMQAIMGFGQKTGIDLPGEAYTASLIYDADMSKIDLATNKQKREREKNVSTVRQAVLRMDHR